VDNDRREKLNAVIKRRDSLKESLQRAQGRKEAATKELASVEEECKKRNLSPDQLNAMITKLRTKYDSEVQAISDQIKTAEEALKPFMEGT